MTAFLLNVGSLSVWLALLVALFVPLEWLFGLPPAKRWRRQMGVDLCWYFINSFLPAAVLSFPLALLASALHAFNPLGFYAWVAGWPLALRIALTVMANDFGAYWGHRAMHSSRLLWRFHALHHSAEEMDWLVTTRAHPLDTVFVRFAGLAPVYLLGFAQPVGPHLDPVVAALTIFGTLWTFFIHSNVRLRLGVAEWLVSTPVFHHWHHTRSEHRDRNFAFLFPFIDRLFGTAWLPQRWPSRYGISAKTSPTLAAQFLDPLDAASTPRGIQRVP